MGHGVAQWTHRLHDGAGVKRTASLIFPEWCDHLGILATHTSCPNHNRRDK